MSFFFTNYQINFSFRKINLRSLYWTGESSIQKCVTWSLFVKLKIESVNVIGKIKSFDEKHFNVKRNFWKFVSKSLTLFNSESSWKLQRTWGQTMDPFIRRYENCKIALFFFFFEVSFNDQSFVSKVLIFRSTPLLNVQKCNVILKESRICISYKRVK